MNNDFTRARFRLVGVYLLIIVGVICLFSFFVIREADETTNSASASTDAPLFITASGVVDTATKRLPGRTVTDAEYEIENGVLYYTVEFDGETDVKGNLFTGEVLVESDEEPSLVETLTDDFDEVVVWIGLGVFLLAALFSIYVANRTLRPIAENLRKQKQFVSGAAHELRNPLAALHARIEAALRNPTYASSTSVFNDLLSETKRLIALSEELLVLERDEQRPREKKMQSMQERVALVLRRLHPYTHEKHIRVVTHIAPEGLRIDARDLETILYNLVHNACKFSPSGGEIRVLWKDSVLTIADDGVGIPASALAHIFDRFYTGNTANAGTGLGLSLVQESVRRYGGTIEVKSNEGTGTQFTVTFP